MDYTVRQVLEITINILGDIAVPRKQNEQIGKPIDAAIHNLRECIAAMDRENGHEEPECVQTELELDNAAETEEPGD